MKKIKIIPMRVTYKELESEVNRFAAEVDANNGMIKKIDCLSNEKGQIVQVFIEYDI